MVGAFPGTVSLGVMAGIVGAYVPGASGVGVTFSTTAQPVRDSEPMTMSRK
jgi:hypothetical protein